MVHGSWLRAVVILMRDDACDKQGRVMKGVGSFLMPIGYVPKLARAHQEFLRRFSFNPARPAARGCVKTHFWTIESLSAFHQNAPQVKCERSFSESRSFHTASRLKKLDYRLMEAKGLPTDQSARISRLLLR